MKEKMNNIDALLESASNYGLFFRLASYALGVMAMYIIFKDNALPLIPIFACAILSICYGVLISIDIKTVIKNANLIMEDKKDEKIEKESII